MHTLQGKIASRSLRVAIIGLGYVGLSLARVFAEAGFRVIGIDTDQQKVDRANRGESYLQDIPCSALQALIDSQHLHCTSDFSVLEQIDAMSICVPTPLSKTCDPDISHIVAVTQQIREYLHVGQLVVLESTTYPGTTDEVILPELESTGLRVGEDFFLAFSPERIDPGSTTYNLRNTPKIVGGVTRACTALAQAYYAAAIDVVVPVSSTLVAEMAKLLENTFRAVNIGLVNEFALMCEKLEVNVWEVIDAATTKPFGFMRFLPGPGLGGHCIPVDPHLLSWKLKTLGYTARFIDLAFEINKTMPHHIVHKIGEALNEQRLSYNGATVLILGVSYKRNVGDIRESPAFDIISELTKRKAEVLYNDEYVPSLPLLDRTLYSQPLDSGLLRAAHCIVIVADHSYYDISWIICEGRCIVDTRNVTRGYNDRKIFRL